MSNTWRGIVENVTTIQKGASVAVGNSATNLFWDHVWADDIPLSDHVTVNLPDDIRRATVQDYWEVGIGWKWDSFAHLLDSSILTKFASYDLVDDPKVGDLIYWKGSANGRFSIKNALSLMRNELQFQADDKWQLVWSLPLQKRVRVFLWLMLHERLLTNVNRVKRRLSDNSLCNRCHTQDETLLHLFRDCSAARDIWRCVGGPAHHSSNSFFTCTDFQLWVSTNLKAEGFAYADRWPSCFAISLWWCWRWRNCVVFGRSANIPTNIGVFLHNRIMEYWGVFYESPSSSSLNVARREEVFIRWRAPPSGWMVLNSDDAARGSPGPAAFKAELKAVSVGIELALNMGVSKLLVQIDNLACVQLLNDEDDYGGECFHILNHVRSLLQAEVWEVKVEHCYREGNKVADYLANLGVEQVEKMKIIELPDVNMRRLMQEDAMGVTTPRFISV